MVLKNVPHPPDHCLLHMCTEGLETRLLLYTKAVLGYRCTSLGVYGALEVMGWSWRLGMIGHLKTKVSLEQRQKYDIFRKYKSWQQSVHVMELPVCIYLFQAKCQTSTLHGSTEACDGMALTVLELILHTPQTTTELVGLPNPNPTLTQNLAANDHAYGMATAKLPS